MTTKDRLIKEGYPEVMPMTIDNLANIIDRYANQKPSHPAQGDEDSSGFHGKVVGKVKYDPETKRLEIIDLPDSPPANSSGNLAAGGMIALLEWLHWKKTSHKSDVAGKTILQIVEMYLDESKKKQQ